MKAAEENIILKPIPSDILRTLSKSDLLILAEGNQQIIQQMQGHIEFYRAQARELRDEVTKIGEYFVRLKNKYFGTSSERKPANTVPKEPLESKPRKSRNPVTKLPSVRYPNAPLIEKNLTIEDEQSCKCCGNEMTDSGMTESSEYVTVIPRQYIVVREIRHKYRCGNCHSNIQTTPALPRISYGAYSDNMIIDIALSKFCDLIPIERYCAMAARGGMKKLPPTSLIETTHALADFLDIVVQMIKMEVLESKVLHADETTHRMLEGSDKSNWYLWVFSGEGACYFECHNTRAGQVASDVLTLSKSEYVISDAYSGYQKAVKYANEKRDPDTPQLKNVYCNAHARRKFVESQKMAPEAIEFVEDYAEIYRIESKNKDKPISIRIQSRKNTLVIFEKMKNRANIVRQEYSQRSLFYQACT